MAIHHKPDMTSFLGIKLVSKTTPIHKLSIFRIMHLIFMNSLTAGFMLVITVAMMSCEVIFIGHLKHSKEIISGNVASKIVILFVQNFITQFNSGLCICISRCTARNEWMLVKHFLSMHHKIYFGMLAIYIIIVSIFTW